MKPRKCVWCGKEFIPKSPRQTSCGDTHYRPCIDCGKLIEVKESYQNYIKSGGRRCPECRKKAISRSRRNKTDEEKADILRKMRETSQKRYGVDNPMQCDEIKERSKQGVRRKYGVDNLSQSPEIQKRIKEHSISKYGVNHYLQSPEIRKKLQDGMIKKYGDTCPSRIPEINNKKLNTVRERYGVDNVSQSDIVKEKMKETCQERYGVDYALQSDCVRESIRNTCRSKYGSYGAPPKLFLDKMEDPIFKKNYLEFYDNTENYIDSHYQGKVPLNKLVKDLQLDFTTVSELIDKKKLWSKVTKQVSSMEVEIYDYIHKLRPELNIVMHDRSQIHPYELDIYLPELNVAIECNPTFTHNSSFKSFSDSKPLVPSYHKRKTDLCESRGIFLFHIFGYEWTVRKDVILSMISNIIHSSTKKIYARKCIVQTVDDKEAAKFLNKNHRQGYCKSSIRIGLYYDNTLVSLMTFGKMRNTIGKMHSDDSNTYELLRFCSNLYTSVIGGASKLFKYFLNHYQFSKIVSFSDRAHTTGKLYQILDFRRISSSEPGYVWVNMSNDHYYGRAVCQKRNLRKLFDDPHIDVDSYTERQIMESHGFAQVFDSGVIRWEYSN